ncbi:MAG: hypothetical protein RID07_01340, partial [Lacipirellulaceae bacterium]
MRYLSITILCLSLSAFSAHAQGPLENIIGGKGASTLSRMPNDQIEGTIWEYKGVLKTGKMPEKKEEAKEKDAKPAPPFAKELAKKLGKDEEGEAKDGKKKSNKKPEISGNFRTEESAIFAASRSIKLSKRGSAKENLKQLLTGEKNEISMPEKSRPKRIGQYHRIRDGKMKLEFDDKNSLHGYMILQLKKKTKDVWIGT